MKSIFIKKIGVLLIFVVMIVGLSACYTKTDNGRVIPKDSVGAISFSGKGLVLFDKTGKRVNAVNEKRRGKELSSATISIVKVNPCYVKWCPSGSACEYYKISEGACPAWW